MKRFWDSVFSLDHESSIWVEEEDLGKEIIFFYKQRRYVTKVPKDLKRETTLYLKGCGKTFRNKTGDFILHVWLNRGEDDRKSLWLSESSARHGTDKKLLCFSLFLQWLVYFFGGRKFEWNKPS